MNIQESGEMYLETILVLSEKLAEVHSVDVGEHMGFSRPSVSRAVNNLKAAGYIEMGPRGALVLTEAGRTRAEKVYERHTILTRTLMALGVDADTAAEDACKIEHDISDTSFDAIKAHMIKGHSDPRE